MEIASINSCIEATGLSIGYKQGIVATTLFENLDLALRPGKLVCLMGPNGIGKSTLIRTLSGLQKPLSGDIKYGSLPPTSHVHLPQHLAVVLTDRITAVNMTVHDLVSFGRYPYLSWNVKLGPHDSAIISRTLSQFHIHHLAPKKIHELSDGQLQMVMIARAVIQDTPVILLDEPTAHLDLNNRLEIMNLLRKLAHESKKAILVSTHELDLALQTADIIWLAGQNKKIITGIPEDLVLNGSFDSIFKFKGFDLRTGKIQHEPYRGLSIKITGAGHEYLWTRNVFERNGFIIADNAESTVCVSLKQETVRWIVDDEISFTTLEALLNHFV
jgi:iron complex transport system ATP-binding protein